MASLPAKGGTAVEVIELQGGYIEQGTEGCGEGDQCGLQRRPGAWKLG